MSGEESCVAMPAPSTYFNDLLMAQRDENRRDNDENAEQVECYMNR
jgi:hypothetical protein